MKDWMEYELAFRREIKKRVIKSLEDRIIYLEEVATENERYPDSPSLVLAAAIIREEIRIIKEAISRERSKV